MNEDEEVAGTNEEKDPPEDLEKLILDEPEHFDDLGAGDYNDDSSLY